MTNWSVFPPEYKIPVYKPPEYRVIIFVLCAERINRILRYLTLSISFFCCMIIEYVDMISTG